MNVEEAARVEKSCLKGKWVILYFNKIETKKRRRKKVINNLKLRVRPARDS